jgi:hypothetical protein
MMILFFTLLTKKEVLKLHCESTDVCRLYNEKGKVGLVFKIRLETILIWLPIAVVCFFFVNNCISLDKKFKHGKAKLESSKIVVASVFFFGYPDTVKLK